MRKGGALAEWTEARVQTECKQSANGVEPEWTPLVVGQCVIGVFRLLLVRRSVELSSPGPCTCSRISSSSFPRDGVYVCNGGARGEGGSPFCGSMALISSLNLTPDS